MARRNASTVERFLEKVVPRRKGCWGWTAAKQQGGYGQFCMDGATVSAQKASYTLFVGPVPEGHDVCHRCDTRECTRPSHLFTATHQENQEDMARKGRSTRGRSRNQYSKD